MTKADALKVPTRRETVILKVYIHCEECQKQVKKALKKLEGVESIAVDAELGKVTVVGLVAASTLVKKLARAGKYAALWSSGARDHVETKHRHFTKLGSAASALDQSMSTHVNNRKLAGAFYDSGAQDIDAAGEDHHDMYQNPDPVMSHDVNYKKKGGKKVSFQGAAHAHAPHAAMSHASLLAVGTTSAAADPYFHSNTLLTGKILTSAVEKDYHNKMDSVEYATNMFSDENAHSCSLM